MQGVERYKVRLIFHDDCWEREFINVKTKIERIWCNNVVEIQHIGSTSIKGIYAKPILDVAVVVRLFSDMDIEAMTEAGYDYCGLQKPDNDRHLFVLRSKNEAVGGLPMSLHHIHVYEPNNQGYIYCVGFRDFLNVHPESAAEYSKLKRKLAEQYPDDRVAYTDGKEAFIKSIYEKLSESNM